MKEERQCKICRHMPSSMAHDKNILNGIKQSRIATIMLYLTQLFLKYMPPLIRFLPPQYKVKVTIMILI